MRHLLQFHHNAQESNFQVVTPKQRVKYLSAPAYRTDSRMSASNTPFCTHYANITFLHTQNDIHNPSNCAPIDLAFQFCVPQPQSTLAPHHAAPPLIPLIPSRIITTRCGALHDLFAARIARASLRRAVGFYGRSGGQLHALAAHA